MRIWWANGAYATIASMMHSIRDPALQDDWSLVGHQWAKRLLQRALAADTAGRPGARLRHAYLILGAQHIGKSTLARALAGALLCAAGRQAPCGVCRACQLMAQGNHPDFRLIQPTDRQGAVDREGGLLRAEQATEIIRNAATRPLESNHKFILIQDFQRANDSFANKLLKTLEEPPPHVILCLTATDRSTLLPTIVSRCQVLALRPLSPTVISTALATRWGVDPERSALLAKLSGGRLGWAVNQLQQGDERDPRAERIDTLLRLVRADRVERLAYAASLAADRNSKTVFGLLETWTTWWRDVLLVQSGCPDACSNLDRRTELERLAADVAPSIVQAYMHTLKRIEGYLRHTVNTRLALDVLLLQLPAPAKGASSAVA